jgi:hypothetical protein
MSKLTREEMETVINFDDSSNEAIIYTSSKIVMRKLDKNCVKCPDQYKLIKEDEFSKTYITNNKKNIKFATKRILTEEQKEKLRTKFKIKNSIVKHSTV